MIILVFLFIVRPFVRGLRHPRGEAGDGPALLTAERRQALPEGENTEALPEPGSLNLRERAVFQARQDVEKTAPQTPILGSRIWAILDVDPLRLRSPKSCGLIWPPDSCFFNTLYIFCWAAAFQTDRFDQPANQPINLSIMSDQKTQ